jgi:hypothetical protein
MAGQIEPKLAVKDEDAKGNVTVECPKEQIGDAKESILRCEKGRRRDL